MFGLPGPGEWIVIGLEIAVILVVCFIVLKLFGKRRPDVARPDEKKKLEE